jgi:hypothetical protein
MKICSGILKHALNQANDEQVHFHNSPVLADNIAFQRTDFRKIQNNAPHLYKPSEAAHDDDLILQTRTNDQNKTLLKIAILIASNALT